MCKEHGLSIRRACRALRLSRSVYAYRPKPRDDGPIIEALTSLADKYPRYGFAKLFQVIRRDGHGWNHKRVYRVYCALKLNLRRKGKKRLPTRDPQPLAVPDLANICWSEVRKITDRRLREYNEECPHESLGNLTPAEYLALNSPEVSPVDWH